LGVDLEDVFAELERDGVAKFQQSWKRLHTAVADYAGMPHEGAGW